MSKPAALPRLCMLRKGSAWLRVLALLLALLLPLLLPLATVVLTATPAFASADLAARVNALEALRKQDRLQSHKGATQLLGELSADDSAAPLQRLAIVDIYCEGLLAYGYDQSAAPIARRGLQIAKQIRRPDYAIMMRGLLALLDYDKQPSAENRAVLEQLLAESSELDLHARARFMYWYHEQLTYGEGIGDAARGTRKLGELIDQHHELDYFRRRFLINIYRIHDAVGDYDSAVNTLKEAMRLAEAAGDTFLIGQCAHLIGRLAGYAGDYALSNEFLLRARAHAQSHGDAYRAFMANRNLARNYLALKQPAQALEVAELAIANQSAESDVYNRATLLLYISRAHIGLGQLAKAEQAFAQATALQPMGSLTERWPSDSRRTLSELLELRGDSAGALRELKAADDALAILQKQDLRNRVAAMRAVSNANELDYRTARLEQAERRSADVLAKKDRQLSRWTLGAGVAALLLAFSLAIAWRKNHHVGYLHRKLQVDNLTQALSRTAIEAYLNESLKRAVASAKPLSVLLLDLDAFKQINDTLGHAQGDAALQWVVLKTRHSIRADDQIGRRGGDECLVVLPGADAAVAEASAGRIRLAVAEPNPVWANAITVSIGPATSGAGPCTAKELVKAADAAMYEVKRKRSRQKA